MALRKILHLFCKLCSIKGIKYIIYTQYSHNMQNYFPSKSNLTCEEKKTDRKNQKSSLKAP
ncbi:MAG: hypothetical protein CVV64_15160 [Candidatus Wallbacteria bacterium HGW-Wallbacteria-1]|uniref:Uncharacterized protein n=1 Tax=Candidatus Wallbacteria bacterium HGW-Wallbacteria-1 TaxID=2013854 RepID=A0A2N1PLN3_9BACT|nr:MAG: hypothetical protein CVV64_15160 [Candidatus Wallbacteria bacterium HGW-Wallbacteria-1]